MISESFLQPGRRWLWPLLASLLILALAASGEPASLALRYDRDAIGTGQWYRLISGHWLHLGWLHAGMNAAAVWLLTAIDTQSSSLRINIQRAVLLSIAVALGLFFLQPDLVWYVGFSGVLHGLFMIVFVRMAWQRRDAFAIALLVLLLGKLVWEHYYGALTQDTLDAPVIVAAHSYGAIAGLLYVALSGIAVHLRRGK